MSYEDIIDNVIEQHKILPVDIMGIGDSIGEYNYLTTLKDSYIRTISDIDNLLGSNPSSKTILEIGSFLGSVSFALKKLGYNVYATDIPEFYNSNSLRNRYEQNGIDFKPVNLRNYSLPYQSNSLDAVIICEVVEHLNFNPLPVLLEINRVLKKDGILYIGMPNQTNLINRIKLLMGKSIHNPIDHFFKQLDRNQNMLVGIHWREYTIKETMELIENMGFIAIKSYYFMSDRNVKINSIRNLVLKLAFSYPPFKTSFVVVGKKIENVDFDFWITEANK